MSDKVDPLKQLPLLLKATNIALGELAHFVLAGWARKCASWQLELGSTLTWRLKIILDTRYASTNRDYLLGISPFRRSPYRHQFHQMSKFPVDFWCGATQNRPKSHYLRTSPFDFQCQSKSVWILDCSRVSTAFVLPSPIIRRGNAYCNVLAALITRSKFLMVKFFD